MHLLDMIGTMYQLNTEAKMSTKFCEKVHKTRSELKTLHAL